MSEGTQIKEDFRYIGGTQDTVVSLTLCSFKLWVLAIKERSVEVLDTKGSWKVLKAADMSQINKKDTREINDN